MEGVKTVLYHTSGGGAMQCINLDVSTQEEAGSIRDVCAVKNPTCFTQSQKTECGH